MMASEKDNIQNFTAELVKARKYCGIELLQISRETCVNIEHIRNLESGNWERIPYPYLRGYLISYAESLGLVREKVLKGFDELNYRPENEPAFSSEVESKIPGVAVPALNPINSKSDEPRSKPPAPKRVPGLFDVLPDRFKIFVAIVILLIISAIAWFTLKLPFNSTNQSSDRGFTTTLESVRQGNANRNETLAEFDPILIEFRLVKPAAVRLFSKDSLYYSGSLRADSTVRVSSTAELALIVERIEDLLIFRNGEKLEIVADPGNAELKISRNDLNIIRRN
jgi:hypothetical protein